MSRMELSSVPTECILGWERNSGWLGDGMIVWKWYVDPQGEGSWIVCDRTDIWILNSEPAATLRVTATAPSGGACGAGYYGLGNYNEMWEGGEWHGYETMMWSGQHLLPADSLAATPAPTKAPPGVNEDGVAPIDELPAAVPVSDASGKPAVDASGSVITTSVLPPKQSGEGAHRLAADAKRTFTRTENGAMIEEVHITLDGLLKR